MKVVLNLVEGRQMFHLAGNYGITTKDDMAKGGEWWAEKASREQDVALVWRLLKKYARRVENGGWEFGPEKATFDWTFELTLHDEERDGVYYLLLAAVDPRSPLKLPVGTLEDIVWPVVRKIRAEGVIRRELKIGTTRPKKIEYDAEPEGNGHAVETVGEKGA